MPVPGNTCPWQHPPISTPPRQFIYISTSELELVAQTIRSRGRISIAELAQVSSELIDLEPKAPKEAPEVDFESDAVMLDPVT